MNQIGSNARVSRRTALLTVLVVLIATAVASLVLHERSENGPVVFTAATGERMVVMGGNAGEAAMGAAVAGRLVVLPGNCLGLGELDGSVEQVGKLVAWPPGTKISHSKPLALLVPAGARTRVLHIGEEVAGTGGETPVAGNVALPPIPTKCATATILVMHLG